MSRFGAMFPYDALAISFNQAMKQIGSDLSFGSDGAVTCRHPETKRDYQITSFWYASLRVIDNLNNLREKKIKGRKIYPVWVFTMHPNIIWGLKARKSLIHLHRFAERGQWDSIPAILISLFSSQTNESIVAGRRISVEEYASLWLDTIGPSIYQIGEYLRPGQLQTWIGVDIDGSDPDFVNIKLIKKVCQIFMGWTIDQYQEFVRHYKNENGFLVNEIEDSLEATRAGVYDPVMRPNAYSSPEEFISHLRRLLPSLENHDRNKVLVFIKKVRILGFTTLQFQPRVNSSSVWLTLLAIGELNGVAGNRPTLLRKLNAQLKLKLEGLNEPLAKWVLDVMAGYSELLLRTNRLEDAVLANCQSALDIKATRLLFKIVGLSNVRVIDLKEDNKGMTIKNVRQCVKFANQVSMCGCSDTPRNLGYIGGMIALMQGFEVIGNADKQPYFGRAHHLCRGGSDLAKFLEVMGSPKDFYSLFQGDDAFFACISPDMALETLVPRVSKTKSTKVPMVLNKLRKEATAAYRNLVEDPDFDKFWEKVSSLSKGLAISARPGSRASNGSSGGLGWESSRAIGVVQTSVAVLAYYPHLYGASVALEKNSKILRKLYSENNSYVMFLIQGLKTLLQDVDILHFRNIAKNHLPDALIEDVSGDFWKLRSVIREIEGTNEFKMNDAPPSIQRARDTVCQLINQIPLTPAQELELYSAMHCLLSFAQTSG